MASKPMSYEESVELFPAWFGKQRRHFLIENGGYDATEAALLARLAGFDPMFVYRVFGHYKDLLAGTSIDVRAIRKSRKVEDWLLAFRGLGLAPQWADLGDYLTKGTMWPMPGENDR